MFKHLALAVALAIGTVALANTSPPASAQQQERSYAQKEKLNSSPIAALNTEQPASSVNDACTVKIYMKNAPEPVPALTVNMDPGANAPNAYYMNCYIYSQNGTQFSEKYREKSDCLAVETDATKVRVKHLKLRGAPASINRRT